MTNRDEPFIILIARPKDCLSKLVYAIEMRDIMPEIILINGKVKHNITLDPTVWIFDERKITLADYLSKAFLSEDETVEDLYQEKKKKRYKKAQWLTDSFVIPARPFIENAGPASEATIVIFGKKDGTETEVPLTDVLEGAFAFSEDGKALTESGPIHFYMNSGPNQEQPIKTINKITLA
jgi:hypothetical protein